MDWLKKIIDQADGLSEEKLAEQILESVNAGTIPQADNDPEHDKKLIVPPGVYIKMEADGKVLIQNVNSDSAVSFGKDVMLVLFDFFDPESDGKSINEFLANWPPESHPELIKNIQLLIASEILIDIGKKVQIEASDDVPQAPTPETNVHINLINHHYMLKDCVRVSAYRRAIENKVKPGKIAMDLGTGTGILAFIAAKAGAEKVYAIEKRSDMVALSKELAIENKIDDKIEYIVGNSAKIDTSLVPQKVDVFISEILGSGIFEENVLEYTLDARDRFCTPDVDLIPCKLDVYAFAYDAGRMDDITREASAIETLYDIKLTKFKSHLENFIQARYERFNTSIYKVMTEQLLTKSLDLKTLTNTMFKDKLEFEVLEDGRLNAFCAYFVAHLDESTTLSNSPWAPNTHWIQKVFVMPQSLEVKKGQKIPITSVYDGDYRIELRSE
ncbi:MAG: 50S ribosomal protein L11 methyltransferase [Vampirovibrionia bacterium]